MNKPDMTWVGTNRQNLWVNAGMHPKGCIVIHTMQGGLDACDSWFSNPASIASANLGVGRGGERHMYVDPEGPDAPFANGNVSGPSARALALLRQYGGRNPNYWTVSIEHDDEGHPGTPYTEAELRASAEAALYYMQLFGIPMDSAHILGHYDFDSITRKGCPGWSQNQWGLWTADLAPATPVADIPDAMDRINSILSVAATMKDLLAELEGDLGTLEEHGHKALENLET